MIFIVSGPGGVGKGTIVKRLLEISPSLRLSRSWTTRVRRPEEPEDAYVFVDRPAFEARIASRGFLEWTEFPGTKRLYGTPTLDADEEGDLILEIELDGAQQVKQVHPASILIFVVAPSVSDLEQRLRGRGDDVESVQRRLAVGEKEVDLGERIADHIVVNDDVDRAAAEVAGIIAGYQSGTGEGLA